VETSSTVIKLCDGCRGQSVIGKPSHRHTRRSAASARGVQEDSLLQHVSAGDRMATEGPPPLNCNFSRTSPPG
jgi:hypothetical protein